MRNLQNLRDFLIEGAWVERFEEEVRPLGTRLTPRVKSLDLEDGEGEICFSGVVSGEQVNGAFWPEGATFGFETTCLCQTGAFCEHGFAVVGKLAREKNLDRLFGRSAAGALAIELKGKTALFKKTISDAPEPIFSLSVKKGEVDRSSKLLLQSLGEKKPENWIYAEATVTYGKDSRPLAAAGEGGKTPAELRAIRELRETGLSSLHSNPAWRFLLNMKSRTAKMDAEKDKWFPDPSRIPIDAFWHQFRGELAPELESLGWRINFEEAVGHNVHDAAPENWQTSLDPSVTEEPDVEEPYSGDFSDGGWFSLSVGFDVEGKRYDLMPILAGLLKQDFLEETLDRPNHGFIYAPLSNGDALKLPSGRVRRILHHLSALVDPKFFGKARVHALDAAALSELENLGIDAPVGIKKLRKRLESFSSLQALETPPGIRATLRDYQKSGFQWMQFLARHGLHGILADDMGLGKTMQTLAHLLAEKIRRNLRKTFLSSSSYVRSAKLACGGNQIRPKPQSVSAQWI